MVRQPALTPLWLKQAVVTEAVQSCIIFMLSFFICYKGLSRLLAIGPLEPFNIVKIVDLYPRLK
jgi:hypothetical protein